MGFLRNPYRLDETHVSLRIIADPVPRVHLTREATVPLSLAAIVGAKIARMSLVVAAPVGAVVIEQHGVIVDSPRGEDQDCGKLAKDVDTLAGWGVGAADTANTGAPGVFDADVEFVVAAWIIGFVLLVLGHMHAAPTGSVSFLHKRCS